MENIPLMKFINLKKKKFIKYIIKLKTKLNGQKIKTYKKKNIKEKNFVFMKR